MSVSVDYFIPDTPPSGSEVIWMPLGGGAVPGYTAPIGMYVLSMRSTGDASGGTNTIQVRCDERYTTLPVFLQVRANLTVDTDVWMAARAEDGDRFDHIAPLLAASPGGTWGAATCRVPPFPMPPKRRTSSLTEPLFFASIDNQNGGDLYFQLRLLSFAADVRQKVPYAALAANLPS